VVSVRLAWIVEEMILLLAAGAFGFVFGFCCRDGLPLHVGGSVRAAAFERADVIYDVASARAAGFSS